MDINEIIFLIQTPLTARDYARFGVERLTRRGFKVSILDLTDILNPRYNRAHAGGAIPYSHYTVVYSRDGLTDFFMDRNFSRSLMMDLTGRRDLQILLGPHYRRCDINLATLCVNSQPSLRSWKSPVLFPAELAGKVIRGTVKGVLEFGRAPYVPQWVIAGASADVKNFPKTPIRVIWAHCLDYDLYLEYQSQKNDRMIPHDYAVLLDEYFPFHPDYRLKGVPANPFPDPMEYYHEINQMLSQFEKKTGLGVVIAAHPRSEYDDKPDFFQGRRVVKGQTIELVAHARCVLAHTSTSMNFAVLFEKPIAFLLCGRMKKHFYGRLITEMARQFNTSPVDLQSIDRWDVERTLSVDLKSHRTYREMYIKRDGTPGKFFWDIFADEVLKTGTNQTRQDPAGELIPAG